MIEILKQIWKNFTPYEKTTIIIMLIQLIVALIPTLILLH